MSATSLGFAGQAHAAQVSFSGGCEFKSSSIRQDRDVPLTMPVQVNSALAGTGECSGTLDGQTVTSATSFLIASLSGQINCVDGTVNGPLTGEGRLEIAGKTIPVRVAFQGASLRLRVRIDLAGASSGAAGGDASVDNRASGLPNDASESGIIGCWMGTMRQAVIDLQFQTTSPLVGGAADPAPAVKPPRLSVPAQRARSVRRRGHVRVRCVVPSGGVCRVKVLRGSTVLASGSTKAGSSAVRARLTPAGRRALRRRGPLKVTVTGTVGATKVSSRALTLR